MSGRVQQVVRFVAASVLVWSVPAGTPFAATKTISWSDGVCANRLVFDPGKVDEVQLQNPVHLLFAPAISEAPTLPPLLTEQAVAKVDFEATSRQCSGALE